MSTINVNNLSGRGGATPNLPDGAVISGVATVTNLKPTNVNVSGAVTATTFDGSLKSTGTPTLGLGVTINASGINVSGVLTATTFKGDGSSLTGVGESISPWYYNPDVNDSSVDVNTGIGITFNKLIEMGSGTATIKIVNAGVAGTTVQSWGVSSVTKSAVTEFTLNSLVSALTVNETYQLDIPEGFVVSSTGTSYAGTAYTFSVTPPERKLWSMGAGSYGELGNNNDADISSPTQIPGTTWVDYNFETNQISHAMTRKTDGTLWAWGNNGQGRLGLSGTTQRSSPTQIPGTTWAMAVPLKSGFTIATKTDGTLWGWGNNEFNGALGQNNTTDYNSPVQNGSDTTWRTTAGSISGGYRWATAIKTDGTLWSLGGQNSVGELGQNNQTAYSSAVQVGSGSDWNYVGGGDRNASAIKTDGTLWTWGRNDNGQIGVNNSGGWISSPVQVPGTTWSKVSGAEQGFLAIKTDGTAWGWGTNNYGQLGLGDVVDRSSPTQIPGTTWTQMGNGSDLGFGLKSDGTLWGFGRNNLGAFGNNDVVARSSPIQITGTETGYTSFMSVSSGLLANQLDVTP